MDAVRSEEGYGRRKKEARSFNWTIFAKKFTVYTQLTLKWGKNSSALSNETQFRQYCNANREWHNAVRIFSLKTLRSDKRLSTPVDMRGTRGSKIERNDSEIFVQYH